MLDNFNRADASTLGTAESGQVWQNANQYGTGSIVSSRAVISYANIEAIEAAANGTLAVTLVQAANAWLLFRYTDNYHFWAVSTTGGT